jgi:hypothetical protein
MYSYRIYLGLNVKFYVCRSFLQKAYIYSIKYFKIKKLMQEFVDLSVIYRFCLQKCYTTQCILPKNPVLHLEISYFDSELLCFSSKQLFSISLG